MGISETKWIANKNPEQVQKNIQNLLSSLFKVECEKIIFISTIDVYDEYDKELFDYDNIEICKELYRKHHLWAEKQILNQFVNKVNIIRLGDFFMD